MKNSSRNPLLQYEMHGTLVTNQYWHYIENTSDEKPIIQIYWTYIENICNLKPIFLRYRHFIGNIRNA